MKRLIVVLLAVASPMCEASAQTCTASIVTPVTFTNVNPLTSATYDTSTTLTVTCAGALPLATIGACQDIGTGTGGVNASNQRLLKGQATGATIPFQLFQDAARTTPWGSTSDTTLGTVPLLSRTGNGAITATIYLRLYVQGPPYPPDTYSSLFTGADARVHYGAISSLLGCSSQLGFLNQTTDDPFTVQSTLSSLCLLNVTGNVDFGTATALSANIDSTGALSVQCTNGTAYQIALDPGNASGATTSSRKMTGPAGATIGYGLYRNSGRSLNWGNNAGVDTVSGTGAGSAVSVLVYGRIPPQMAPGVGSYSDSVVVTVTY